MARDERLFPDKPLGEPVKQFSETFSAKTVLMKSFFANLTPEQKAAALANREVDV